MSDINVYRGKWWSEEPRCKTCVFGTGEGKQMSCVRYPKEERVSDVHWCGEWKPSNYDICGVARKACGL